MTVDSPVFSVSADGISAPAYDEVLEYYQDKAREIFGPDVNLDADTQDGQLIAIFALALSEVNAQAIALYSQFSPATASGAGLDAVVKQNGLARHTATHSTADVRLVGQAGTIIENGRVKDDAGNAWNLPARVSIPLSGEVTVTATCEAEGAVQARAGAISTIATPTLGWQSAESVSDAAVGAAVESDAELRARQSVSTMQAGSALWDALLGAVEQIEGVQSVAGKHNDTGEVSADGIPAHSIAVVAEGGDAQEIAETIFRKKSMGVSTYGAVESQVIDTMQNIYTVRFSRPTPLRITAALEVRATDTWRTTEQDDIKNRLISYMEGLSVGESVNAGKCVAAIIKHDDGEYDPDFSLEGLKLNGSAASVPAAWNQKAVIEASDITITVK